jgi:transposase
LALYPSPEATPQPKKTTPDYAAVHEELRTHRHVTLQLLWEEYREAKRRRRSRMVKKLDLLESNHGCG